MVLQAIKYSRGHLGILDQLRLPHEEVYNNIKNSKDAWHAIKSMQVRGAPAIAIVAALSVAVEAAECVESLDHGNKHTAPSKTASANATAEQMGLQLDYLVTSRPTAVNLADAASKLKVIVNTAASKSDSDCRAVLEAYTAAAEQMLIDDVKDNEAIGKHGGAWIMEHARISKDTKVSVITHCNTG